MVQSYYTNYNCNAYVLCNNLPDADPLLAVACTTIWDDDGLLSIIVIVNGPPCSGVAKVSGSKQTVITKVENICMHKWFYV